MTTYKFFPQDIKHLSWNSKFDANWTVEVQTAGSGMSRSLTNQMYPRWTITESVGLIDDETADKLLGFFNSLKGAYTPFYWYDHSKNHESNIQLPMTSPGVYQAVIKTGDYVEPAEYIEDVTVSVNGTEVEASTYTVSAGSVRFKTAPATGAVVTASYKYWWLVRLSGSSIGITRIFENLNNSRTFKMEVVR